MTSKNHIILNDEKTFKENYERLEMKKKLIVLFHAGYCGHFVNMRSEWNAFKKQNPSINIIEIEASYLSRFPKDHWISMFKKSINGYPCLLKYSKGSLVRYEDWFHIHMQTPEQFRSSLSFKKFAKS